jgi:hypothetical protein
VRDDRSALLTERRLLSSSQTMLLRQLRDLGSYDHSALARALRRQRDRNVLRLAQIESALRAIEQWRP